MYMIYQKMENWKNAFPVKNTKRQDLEGQKVNLFDGMFQGWKGSAFKSLLWPRVSHLR